MSNLNDFPTDNSSSINLKYDIIASKFITGIRNHERRTAPAQSSVVVFYRIGAVLEFALAILVVFSIGLLWFGKAIN